MKGATNVPAFCADILQKIKILKNKVFIEDIQ